MDMSSGLKRLEEELNNAVLCRESAPADIADCPEELRPLFLLVKDFQEKNLEVKQFALQLAKGDLDASSCPGKENLLAAPLKQLQAHLCHLVWQAQQIAAGDYDQSLDYFGVLSEVFNEMRLQLKDREMELKDKNCQLNERAARLKLEAEQDALTGMYNRRAGMILLAEAVATASEEEPLCLAVLDMDNLKDVNDSLGHSAGDQAILTMARHLKRAAREDDSICRIGGDEFLVLLPRCKYSGAAAMFGRAAKTLQECSEGPDGAYPVCFSYGIYEISDNGVNAQEAFDIADSRMYEYKRRTKRK